MILLDQTSRNHAVVVILRGCEVFPFLSIPLSLFIYTSMLPGQIIFLSYVCDKISEKNNLRKSLFWLTEGEIHHSREVTTTGAWGDWSQYNLGRKCSLFLTPVFAGQESGRTLGSLLRVSPFWIHSAGQAQALLQALGKYLLLSSVSAGEIQFSLLKMRFLIFLLDIHHGSIFGNLTLCVKKNPSGWSC